MRPNAEIDALAEKLEEVATCCTLAIAHLQSGGIEDAVTTLDETIDFGGDTLEKVQNGLSALFD